MFFSLIFGKLLSTVFVQSSLEKGFEGGVDFEKRENQFVGRKRCSKHGNLKTDWNKGKEALSFFPFSEMLHTCLNSKNIGNF